MKIGIDGTTLAIPFYCGTKNYSQNLLYALAKIDKKNEYFVFAPRNVGLPVQKNFHLVKTPTVLPFFKRQFFLSYFARKYDLDIFHYLNSYGDVFLKHPNIITTVHDTGLDMTFPYLSKYFLNRVICEVTRASVFRRSKVLITGTSVIEDELNILNKKLNISPNVEVTHYGVDNGYLNMKRSTKKREYILCMGDFSLRKNIYMCLTAYSGLEKKYKSKHPIVIVSSGVESTENFEKYIHELKLSKFAKVLTNVSANKLKDLYRNAFCFLFPSLYEGFGFPILESMASGTPVITSNYGAMLELAGGFAITIDPTSKFQIKKALVSLMDSKKLVDKYTKLGYKRANEFSWEKTARKTLKIYNTMVK